MQWRHSFAGGLGVGQAVSWGGETYRTGRGRRSFVASVFLGFEVGCGA